MCFLALKIIWNCFDKLVFSSFFVRKKPSVTRETKTKKLTLTFRFKKVSRDSKDSMKSVKMLNNKLIKFQEIIFCGFVFGLLSTDVTGGYLLTPKDAKKFLLDWKRDFDMNFGFQLRKMGIGQNNRRSLFNLSE